MKGEKMNSVEMLSSILRSDPMRRYIGIGEISPPFSLKDRKTAMFLFIESKKKDAIRGEGIFVRDEKGCIYEESPYEIENMEEELKYAEGFSMAADMGLKVSDYESFKTELQALYDAYDSFADQTFLGVYDLSSEMQQAVQRYSERLVKLGDPLRLALYYHYSPEFMEWCRDICSYVQIMS